MNSRLQTRAWLLASVLALSACARPPAPASDGASTPSAAAAGSATMSDAQFQAWLRAERARVAQERASADQRYQAAELACWRRFAVNDCLDQAKRERRQTLDALRRQDLDMNTAERQRNAAERLREIEQKAPPASAPAR